MPVYTDCRLWIRSKTKNKEREKPESREERRTLNVWSTSKINVSIG